MKTHYLTTTIRQLLKYRMVLTQRLHTSPSTTPRTGGIAYTVQAVIEDIPLNTSLSFLHRVDMLTLNDSEGILPFKHNNNMTGGWGFALLRPGKTPVQLEARFRGMDLKHTWFREKSIAPYFAGITLDTERRQKEVAIRKVNGAGLKQIILLAFSALVAFPLCYAVFQAWKKMYIVFFNDGPLSWIILFTTVTLITLLTIAFRILKIAKTNPAEVIKSE